jgi:hypothetical protein
MIEGAAMPASFMKSQIKYITKVDESGFRGYVVGFAILED